MSPSRHDSNSRAGNGTNVSHLFFVKKSDEAPNMSPKRKQGDEDVWFMISRRHSRRKVTVLEIGELEREYILVLARLQLLKVDADPSQATGATVLHI